MSKFIISLGSINKKLLIPFLYIILYSFINIYYDFLDSTNSDDYGIAVLYTKNFGYSFSEVMIYFFANSFRYKSHNRKRKNTAKQNYIKDFSILFLFIAFWMIYDISPYYIRKEGEKVYGSVKNLYINDAIVIIFITFATYFLLKYKYYKHHIISIIFFIILCIISDLILENFTNRNIYFVILSIISILAESFYYSYSKYLIEYKYYFFMDLWFICGIFYFTSHFISLVIITIIDILNGSYDIFFQFNKFYKEKGSLYMIFRFFFGFIVDGFFVDLLEFLMLDKLSPNYIAIGYVLSRIPSNLIGNKGVNIWLILIVSTLEILALLFYLEILEYNFCNLNRDTRKNIKEREINEIEYFNKENERDATEAIVNVDGYFYSLTSKTSDIEMTEKNKESEESFDI